MNWVILDGTEGLKTNEKLVTNYITETMKKSGMSYVYYDLKDMNILACRSCGFCGFKSPGRCVYNDDMPDVIRAIAKSRGIIFLTPIRFGGYSSNLKKAVDKLALMGLPLYIVKEGNLLHPMRYGHFSVVGIGISNGSIEKQDEAFKLLVERNALNMQAPHCGVLTINMSEEINDIENKVMGMIEEVSSW